MRKEFLQSQGTGSVESQSASGSLVIVSVIADTPEGAYPLSAVLMKLKKFAKMMPDFLLSQGNRWH
ncbi:MAG TPA: hypothetical protein VJB08_05845 [Candidatus Nanoarchaeia archaeon]|nr:hypothetical protein [Candidatus Nanoarchaeia archaeon]